MVVISVGVDGSIVDDDDLHYPHCCGGTRVTVMLIDMLMGVIDWFPVVIYIVLHTRICCLTCLLHTLYSGRCFLIQFDLYTLFVFARWCFVVVPLHYPSSLGGVTCWADYHWVFTLRSVTISDTHIYTTFVTHTHWCCCASFAVITFSLLHWCLTVMLRCSCCAHWFCCIDDVVAVLTWRWWWQYYWFDWWHCSVFYC